MSELVNSEIDKRHETILSFSVKCEISYNEMRKICNGTINDIRISTIHKICENSDITMVDIFMPNRDIDIIVRYKDDKFRVKIKKC